MVLDLQQITQLNHGFAEAFPYLQDYGIAGLRLRVHHYYALGVQSSSYSGVGAHQHEWWEISRVVSGKIEYHQKESLGQFDRKAWFIMPPGITHSWKVSAVPMIVSGWQVWIDATSPESKQLLAALKETVINSRFRFPSPKSVTLLEEACWEEALRSDALSISAARMNYLSGALLCGILNHGLRSLVPEKRRPITAMPEGRIKNLVANIVQFIGANIGNQLQIEDILSHVHFSTRQLNRHFLNETGCTLSHFIQEKKLAEAKKRLTYTDAAVKDVALSLGFRDTGYFCRLFRRRTGMTPLNYRSTTRDQIR